MTTSEVPPARGFWGSRSQRIALAYGGGAFAAVLILGQITAARILQAGSSQSVWAVVQRGLEGFFLLNPAALRLTGPPGVGLDLVLRADLLVGSGVAVFICYLGGRKVADRSGGTPIARALHGAAVGVPYAVLSFACSFLVSLRTASPVLVGDSPLSTGEVWFRVPHVWALAGPLAMAAGAGFAGGLFSARRKLVSGGGWGRRIVAALAGGWRMLVTGIGLAFVGLLVVLALNGTARHSYVDAFHSGFGKSPFVMSAPNQALFVLVPSMGGCTGVYGGQTRIDLLCYRHFPVSSEPEGFGPAPWPYFLFLVVPGAAVLCGGFAAARVGKAGGHGEGTILGLLAGAVFAVLLAVVAAIGSPAVGGLFAGREMAGYAGPHRIDVLIAGLAWGLVGGAIGGAIRRPQGADSFQAQEDSMAGAERLDAGSYGSGEPVSDS